MKGTKEPEKKMTVAQAIYLLDPETTVEAIAEIEYYHGFSGRTAAVQAVTDATVVACEVMRNYERVEKERDAAVADLALVYEKGHCAACGHFRIDWPKPGCELNGLTCAWTWRGVQE